MTRTLGAPLGTGNQFGLTEPVAKFGLTEPKPTLRIPVRLIKRGGAKLAVGPDGTSAIRETRVDAPLASALLRAEAWKRQLLAGEYDTVNDLARAEAVSKAYVLRLLRVAFLAPDLKASILDGRQPIGLTLEAVTRQEFPLDWDAQRSRFAQV